MPDSPKFLSNSIEDENLSLVSLSNEYGMVFGEAGYHAGFDAPFVSEVFLCATRVAGTGYVENIEEIADDLEEGSMLSLIRQPENKFDEWAIVVMTEDGDKVGFVPRSDNQILARLMDAGKYLFAKVKNVYENEYSDFIGIRIDIYLRD